MAELKEDQAIHYAIAPGTAIDRSPRGHRVRVGYDLYRIEGHASQGDARMLRLRFVGWSRTLDGIETLIARRQEVHHGQ